MKPKPTLQVKRQPASGYRILRAVTSKTRRKRAHRAATTAEPEDIGEVPGVGVARALVVILLLHVAAIAGIWVHNQWTSQEEQQAEKNSEGQKTPMKPNLIPGVEHYLVLDGDNYFDIAKEKGVSVDELKRINSGVDIVPGIEINIPGRRILPEYTVGESAPMLPPVPKEELDAVVHTEHPLIQITNEKFVEPPALGELTVEEYAPAELEEPVLLIPNGPPALEAEPRKVRVTQVAPAPVPAGRVHTFRKGDSIWRLSKTYGVSQDQLMRLNGITDPGRIRAGQKIRIPGH